MGLLKKLSGLFSGSPGKPSFRISVECGRCGEVIRARIDLNNDLSAEYGEDEKETTYFCRKVLIGKESCHVPIEVELRFDDRRNLLEKRIKGGSFVQPGSKSVRAGDNSGRDSLSGKKPQGREGTT